MRAVYRISCKYSLLIRNWYVKARELDARQTGQQTRGPNT
jgi:hypothetical protein